MKLILTDLDVNALAIVDFDGTICKGSLVLEHAVYLEENGVIDTQGISALWNIDRKNEKLITQLAIAYQTEITGKNINDLMIKEYVAHFIKNNDFYETFKLFNKVDVQIISGSASFLIDEFVRQIQPTTKQRIFAVGTEYVTDNNIITGKLKPMFGALQKKDYIENAMKDLINEYALTIGCGDTLSDEYIFRNSEYRILVEPTYETLKEYSIKQITFDSII